MFNWPSSEQGFSGFSVSTEDKTKAQLRTRGGISPESSPARPYPRAMLKFVEECQVGELWERERDPPELLFYNNVE